MILCRRLFFAFRFAKSEESVEESGLPCFLLREKGLSQGNRNSYRQEGCTCLTFNSDGGDKVPEMLDAEPEAADIAYNPSCEGALLRWVRVKLLGDAARLLLDPL